MHEIAWQHGNPDNCQYLQEHSLACRSTVNLLSQWLTSNLSAPLLIAWHTPERVILAFSFLRMLGHTVPMYVCDLDLFCWILITFLLIVSNIVTIGKNLASTIHLLNVSHMLLSTESQFDPILNQALLQWAGSVFIKACAPSGVYFASLALARLNNDGQGASTQC